MKTTFSILFLLTFLFGQDTLRYSVGDEWYPYYYSKGDSLSGLDIKLTKAIFRNAKIPYTIRKVPSVRAQQNIQFGKSDFLSGASFTEERNRFAYFSIPYRSEEIAILVKRGNRERYAIHSLKEIIEKNIYIGAERGAWYGDEYGTLIEDTLFQKQLKLNANLKDRIQMLQLNRVQMVIDDKNALLSSAAALNLKDSVELLEYRPYSDSVRFMFSRKSVPAELVHKISGSIETLKSDSTLRNIIDSFNSGM